MNQLLADYDRKIVVPTGQINGAIVPPNFEEYIDESSDSEDEPNQQYENDYVSQEMQKYASMERTVESTMCSVEGVDGIDYSNNPLSVYSNYNFNTTAAKKELPIDAFKQKILDLLNVNSVLVIQGPTGCGKTTQVPQYILDMCRENREYCNIAVTQPRKIATINVAKRVCEERGWTLGTVVGYQVGLEKKISTDVLLTYMTTGVLLQKLIQSKSLPFTHIVIDEVHERNQDLDFLLLIVRRFHFMNSPKTKIILMSATIEAEEFAYYFRFQGPNIQVPAPIVYVDKQSNYRKSYFYLEDLKTIKVLSDMTFCIDKPEITEDIWILFIRLVKIIDKLDSVDPVTGNKIIGSVLVFLPGINEIEEAHNRLMRFSNDVKVRDQTSIQWDIIPLHSSLPNDEQALVFKPAKPGYRKVILSTNIAESSITVPDSYYVIDFCLTKVMTVDPVTKYMSLKLEWASHTNCEQRAGRVGRIGNGRVYRLVPSEFYHRKMREKSIPEMLRAPLERVVLQSKMLNLNDTPRQILALALNPPDLKNIEMTILSLKEMGGLLQTCRGMYAASDGDITFMGTVMAQLPIDARLSKLIVLGYLFSCLEEAIIMAAGCSIQNIFSAPFQQRFNAYKKLLMWADGSYSDLIALLNVYQVWRSCKRDNQFENVRAEYTWCQRHLVSLKALREWSLLVTEITQRLEHMNIQKIPGQAQLKHDEKPLILKVIAAGAFYPNYFIRDPDSGQVTEKDAVKVVGGRNPFRTVYFTGMDPRQPGPLYVRAIKDIVCDREDTKANAVVGFDGSSKVYVEFRTLDKREQVTVSVNGNQMVTDSVPSRIPREVYEIIRKRQLRYDFSFNVLPEDEAWSYVKQHGIKINSSLQAFDSTSPPERDRSCFTQEEYSPIPTLDVQYITVKISEFIDAGHYWMNQFDSEQYLAAMDRVLNKSVLRNAIEAGERISLGKIYAARYHSDNLFYRCQILSLSKSTAQVIFTDYGNIQQCEIKDIYLLPNSPICNMAPLALECVLHGVQPSRKMNPKSVWSDTVNSFWKKQLMGLLLHAKVHSVVDNVAHIILYKHRPNQRQTVSVNEMMLEKGHADPASESFLSKSDHEKRERVIQSANPSGEAQRLSYDKVVNYQDVDNLPALYGNSYRQIHLKGPHNPLEMKMYGLQRSAGHKSVDVEGQSVNTVLLDNQPEDSHTRLLVATSVNQSTSGERLKLRQTTLMPNIPGLPMLLMMIFCPTMEVKLNEDATRVAAILCGLGTSKMFKKSLYPSHDLLLTLDTELTEDEVNKVNTIRFYMNQGINLMQEISNNMSSQEEMISTQQSLRKELIALIYEDRKVVPRVHVTSANVWGQRDSNLVELKPSIPDETDDIWLLHGFVKLRKTARYSGISTNLEDLQEMARTMIPFQEIECQLCRVVLYSTHEIRLHLISTAHKAKVDEYNDSFQSENDDDDDDDDDE